jgi:hypothetical protein
MGEPRRRRRDLLGAGDLVHFVDGARPRSRARSASCRSTRDHRLRRAGGLEGPRDPARGALLMFLADVIGTVVSPIQIPILDGQKLLLLRPLTPDGGAPAGRASASTARRPASATA